MSIQLDSTEIFIFATNIAYASILVAITVAFGMIYVRYSTEIAVIDYVRDNNIINDIEMLKKNNSLYNKRHEHIVIEINNINEHIRLISNEINKSYENNETDGSDEYDDCDEYNNELVINELPNNEHIKSFNDKLVELKNILNNVLDK